MSIDPRNFRDPEKIDILTQKLKDRGYNLNSSLLTKLENTRSELQAKTETTISIEEIDEKGRVEILGTNQEGIDAAVSKIKSIAFVPEEGETYKGKVKSIMPYGAFVGIAPNTDGLLHVSEISWERVANVEDVLKEGQEIEVKLISIDPKSGKLKLSRKVLLPKPEKK